MSAVVNRLGIDLPTLPGPSERVSGYAGTMLRWRERLDGRGLPDRWDPYGYTIYSLAAEATRRWGLPIEDWARHSDWMRRVYDVRTLERFGVDYILRTSDMRGYIDWYWLPSMERFSTDPRAKRAKDECLRAQAAGGGIMFADWVEHEKLF